MYCIYNRHFKQSVFKYIANKVYLFFELSNIAIKFRFETQLLETMLMLYSSNYA